MRKTKKPLTIGRALSYVATTFLLCFSLLVVAAMVLGAMGYEPTASDESMLPQTGAQPTTTGAQTDIEVDGEVVLGYYDVIELVGISQEDAEKIEKIDDWYGGPRYSFETEGTTARVYCNPDGTINTVKVGVDIDLYKQGFEPWRIENFLVDDATKEQLIYCAEEAVSACLNYPDSADFPLLDWSFGREFNRYTVNSSVKAYNAFGVYSEIPFTAGFWVADDTIKLVYLMLDGDVVVDESADYPIPERAEVPVENQTATKGEIRIVDGQLGEFGETVSLGGESYIWYHIPAGTYRLTCNAKQCVVYLDRNEVITNSSGYVEVENVATYELKYGDTVQVDIGEDEHLFNSIYADFTLVPAG